MRQMRIKVDDELLYESFFDPRTGNLIRRVLPWSEKVREGDWVTTRTLVSYPAQDELKRRFPHRYGVIPSPSPELVDVSITDKCSFGCSYCYQDSTAKRAHARRSLIPTLLKGFDTVPYQIAIGGGEPCGVPDFDEILHEARSLGTVPNYTTAGHIFRPAIIEATNKVCGGVALTYHAFKGIEWFEKTYQRWRSALTCQLNVHLIADKDAAKNLDALTQLQKRVGRLNVVLLAYYPDVGRASLDYLMTRRVYSYDFPRAISHARATGMGIAFSEGLLSFFLSRPEIGINTDFATRSEGVFSCYVDPQGRMSTSSFDKPNKDAPTIFKRPSQALWQDLQDWRSMPGGEACYTCKHKLACSTPSPFHYLACAFASHNRLPLHIDTRSRYDRLKDEEDES